jgi:hypothetical protein
MHGATIKVTGFRIILDKPTLQFYALQSKVSRDDRRR